MRYINQIIDRCNDRIFDTLYSRSLVYNTCWEDPAVDRQALQLNADDNVLVITSAGCNVLDYALTAPKHVFAVDMNPRQTALLELKLAGIRGLEFADFFQIFGRGHHPDIRDLYQASLRPQLSHFARRYWDKNYAWFVASSERRGFYYHGLSGRVARMFLLYLGLRPQLRSGVEALLSSNTLDEQREVFGSRVQPYMWSRDVNWVLSRQFTMNMVGVPHPQRKEVENQHAGGVAGFIREAIEYVFQYIPLSINYFWRLYLDGAYNEECCPEYLRRDNFYRLKHELIERISCYTCSVTEFLERTEQQISKFVLLDHMDWMSSYKPDALATEWRAILDCATEQARIIFRSAHQWPSYLEAVSIPSSSGNYPVTERLQFHPELAAKLHRFDRVHTYAGFHIADVRT